jgi:hypothetical protein
VKKAEFQNCKKTLDKLRNLDMIELFAKLAVVIYEATAKERKRKMWRSL